MPAPGLRDRSRCPGGGIGRRAGFRYLWPQGRGSSSLLLGTIVQHRARAHRKRASRERHPVHAERHHPSAPARPAGRRSISARWSPSTPRRWGSTRIATGSAWCSSRPATARPSRAAHPARARRPRLRLPEPGPPAGRSRRDQADAFRPLRRRGAAARARHHRRPGPLHQDRRQAGPHLHRPPRAQGSLPRLLGVELSKQQQTSDWGAPSSPPSNSPMPPPTCCTCTRCGPSWKRCWPRGPAGAGAKPASPSCRRARRLDLLGYESPTSSRIDAVATACRMARFLSTLSMLQLQNG